MTDYIKRDDAVKTLRMIKNCVNIFMQSIDDAANAVDDLANAADVRENVHGEWKPRDLTWGRSYYFCSACEQTIDMPTAMGIPLYRFCPYCGAIMKEGDDE